MAEYLKSEADALKALEDSLAEIPGEYEALLEELTEFRFHWKFPTNLSPGMF